LTDWIVEARGRLLCLSGLPGVGKSWLAVKLAERVRGHFRRFIYEDLRDRPYPLALVQRLLTALNVDIVPHATFAEALETLVQTLVTCPSFIVLDGTEALCKPQDLAGVYEPEFADYPQLLNALASREHQSCLVWVGRELPRATSAIAGSSCRQYLLGGLSPEELAALAVWSPQLRTTPAAW
jgi:hypothetical protein